MSPRFLCVIPDVVRFSSEVLQAIISYWAESHLESSQTSTMELPRENNQRTQDMDCFRKNALLPTLNGFQMRLSDRKGAVNMGCRWTGRVWNLQPQVRPQGSG